MRIYPKQLKSLHHLQKEKQKLALQKQVLDEDDMFSLENISSKVTGEGGSWIDMLPISNPFLSTGLKLLRKRFLKRTSRVDERSKREEVIDEKPSKNVLWLVAKEVLGGYLKWKAIELSIKGIKAIIKNSRNADDED